MMPFFIASLDKRLQKVASRIGHAACVLPDKYRNKIIDGLLVALAEAQEDRETTPYEREELRLARERLLSAVVDSPMKVRLEHGNELDAMAEKNRVTRAKRQEDLSLKRHRDAYMAEAARKYVPPTRT